MRFVYFLSNLIIIFVQEITIICCVCVCLLFPYNMCKMKNVALIKHGLDRVMCLIYLIV